MLRMVYIAYYVLYTILDEYTADCYYIRCIVRARACALPGPGPELGQARPCCGARFRLCRGRQWGTLGWLIVLPEVRGRARARARAGGSLIKAEGNLTNLA